MLAIAVATVSLILTACGGTAKKAVDPPSISAATTSSTPTPSAPATTSAAAPTTTAPPPTSPVHIRLLNSDGATYGVGMPIVAYFSAKITNAKAFVQATTVKVNGTPNQGSWYFEASSINPGYPIEGHYRPASTGGDVYPFWPAHATITMDMATQGVSAGPGLAYDDSLTLSMATGDAHVSYVDCSTERMTVTNNGAQVGTPYLTSCGASNTPTSSGIKVVQQLGEDTPGTSTLRPSGAVRMVGGGGALGNYDLIVPWSVRITNGGEYVHAAAWNGHNIGARSTSDGCTNLNTPDAEAFYKFSQIGDVVVYSNTGGPAMKEYDGFGDWNVTAATWNTGGVVPVT